MRVQVPSCILLVLLLIILPCRTSAQNNIQKDNNRLTNRDVPEKIQFRHLTQENGLSDNYIHCILQDSKGFIWIGTPEGLNRYDSRKAKIFKHSPDDPNSLGEGGVYALCEDNSGNLWVGTGGGGLNRYNHEQENFSRYLNPDDSAGISNFILSIYIDKSGIIWAGTQYNGLFAFNPENEKSTYYKNIPGDPTSISENRVWTIFEDSKNNLWVGTLSGGLNKFNRNNKKFTRYLHDPDDPVSISFNAIAGIREDKSGNLWIATFGGGLNKLNYKDNKPFFTHYKYDPRNPSGINDNYLVFVHIDQDNVLWLGTAQGGLNRSSASLDEKSLSFISYKNDLLDKFSLLGDYVSWIYEDNSGLLWIASQGQGINIFSNKHKQFRYYGYNPGDPSSLSSANVTVIFEDRSGLVWIGTQDAGLNKWNRTTNEFTHYKHIPGNPNSISDNQITDIYEDMSGTLWIGTYYGGLNKFNKESEKFYAYRYDPLNPGSISEDIIISIAEDTSGILWIGTPDNGLHKFEKDKETFTYIKYKLDDPGDFSSTYAASLFVDKSGILWISARIDGLFAYNYKKDEFVHYKNDPRNPNSLSNNVVRVIFEDKSGTLWFGTAGSGLDRFNKKNNTFKNYNIKNGLPGNYINCVLEDGWGNLWISTNNGLSKFDPRAETFNNFDTEGGFQSPVLWAGYKSRTGEFIFGSGNGFIVFHPDSIKKNTKIPPVYITEFSLFNKPVVAGYDSLNKRRLLDKSPVECEEIKLNYDENVFSFEFAALDYIVPSRNKYGYKMEGFDNDWIYTDASKTSATYTNLNPGKYIFRVKASNNDGIWNETGASIRIIILPPWWRTSWAYIFYILLFGSILYFTWKANLKRVKTKHEIEMSRFEAQKLHEVDEMKSKFFTNISHEFRTPLTLILGPVKQISESIKDEKTRNELSLVHKNANKLLRLVNQLLDISKLESGNMKLQTVPQNIIPVLDALVLSFSSYAERKNISLKFNPDNSDIIVYLDSDKLEKAIINILSNALKFTPDGGTITVNVCCNGKNCNIIIIDTGIGISKEKLTKIFDRFYQVDGSHTKEQEGTGIGLALTKEFVELHKGSIKVESEEGKGSIFTISIPLGKEHLNPDEICEKESQYDKEIISFESGSIVRKDKIDIGLLENHTLPLLLIVEDNSDVRKFIRSILQTGYRIFEAVDGEDGLNKALDNIPDLIMSDVMMPKMDGFKLCEKLKTDQRTSHIPVILLTAKAAIEDKLGGFEIGADEYIMKPFEPDELKARIKNLLEQRKRLHEHFQKEGISGLNQTKITPADRKFLQQACEIISQNISNEAFSVKLFAGDLSVSKSLLHKKIVSLTGEPPNEFIRRIRLNKAANLIEQKSGNISEIALEVGFSNPAYFSECFKKQFGMPPSQYTHKY